MAQDLVQYTVNLNGNALQGMARLDNAKNKACAACQKANSQFAKTGDKVTIQLGYNGNLQTEFKGYLKTIQTDDKNITLECEDALWLWRVDMKDEQLQNITLKTLLQHILSQVNAARKNVYSLTGIK